MNIPFICSTLKAKCIILFTLLFAVCSLKAQTAANSETNLNNHGFLFTPTWSYQKAGGDLKERFYDFTSVGISIEYKTQSNFQFGFDYDWYYGNHVKDSTLFESITASSGQIIDQNGNYSVVRLSILGNYVSAKCSYVYPIVKSMENSGIIVSLGLGVMQHKINIFSSQVSIPQINGEYEKGYDRLTYGFATKQFIGYQYLVNSNKLHFRVGVEFNQGFTQGRRTWNYNTNSSGLDKRFDATTAFKIGLIVPVYTKHKDDEEFFIN